MNFQANNMSNLSEEHKPHVGAKNEVDNKEKRFELTLLFMTFLSAGGLTIGDGYATIAPLKRAIVARNKWMSEDEFLENMAIVQAMPGIFTINFAIFFGKKMMGWKGSAACLLGMVLPPLFIFLVFATFYKEFCEFSAVKAFLRGARPAIVAIILLPAFQMWQKACITLSTIWIPIGAAIAIGLLGISPSYIILALIVLAALYAVFVHSSND